MHLDVAIAGASFRSNGAGVEIVGTLIPGQKLTLETEPSNPYDRNAVKVLVDDFYFGRVEPRTYHLGYVPKRWSGTVSMALGNDNLYVWAAKLGVNWGLIRISWVDLSEDPL